MRIRVAHREPEIATRNANAPPSGAKGERIAIAAGGPVVAAARAGDDAGGPSFHAIVARQARSCAVGDRCLAEVTVRLARDELVLFAPALPDDVAVPVHWGSRRGPRAYRPLHDAPRTGRSPCRPYARRRRRGSRRWHARRRTALPGLPPGKVRGKGRRASEGRRPASSRRTSRRTSRSRSRRFRSDRPRYM